jgi:hypothetical protein
MVQQVAIFFTVTLFLALISSVHIHAKQKQIEIKQNNFEKVLTF